MKIGPVTTDQGHEACRDIRRAVFMGEQGVTEAEEWDVYDTGPGAGATYFLAEDAHGPAATARLIPKGQAAKIGRVAVLPRLRGTGLGQELMQVILDHARAAGFTEAELESQVSVIGFYERLGFRAEGPVYDDAGIPHRWMRRPLTA